MPPAMVKKWAKDIGMANKEAERRWRKAKLLASREGRNPEQTDQPEDWKYVVGIYKTMMRKRDKAEAMVEAMLSGASIDLVFSEFLE